MKVSSKSKGVFYLFSLLVMNFIQAEEVSSFQQCIFEKINTASDETTLGEIKGLCMMSIPTDQNDNKSTNIPKSNNESVLSFTAHKDNYIFPVSYNSSPNSTPYTQGLIEEKIHNFEIAFQLSSKMKILDNIFGDNGDLFGAYTGRFWWQAYNNDLSSPFRETNHEPELFIDFETDYHFGEWHLQNIVYGMVHQSNGRSMPLSRSWNRLYMEFNLSNKDAWIKFKPWLHVPEDTKVDAQDPTGDDNPDISRFMGNFELTAGYDFGKNHISVMLRDNLRKENRGAAQLNWTFPIWETTDVRGYIQYFKGYGESMIDYNASTNRFSIGFIMWESNFE
ncbi:MAG: phospholipase A [Gammaproteobacteria bacterium]|nr:phospholipase A [Gammaproteobacteria bacterium]